MILELRCGCCKICAQVSLFHLSYSLISQRPASLTLTARIPRLMTQLLHTAISICSASHVSYVRTPFAMTLCSSSSFLSLVRRLVFSASTFTNKKQMVVTIDLYSSFHVIMQVILAKTSSLVIQTECPPSHLLHTAMPRTGQSPPLLTTG